MIGVELESLEQAPSVSKHAHSEKVTIANFRLAIADLRKSATGNRKLAISSLPVIIDSGRFILFLGERFAGHSILTFNPPAEIDKLAPLVTEGTKGIVFPLDRLTTGWAFHES